MGKLTLHPSKPALFLALTVLMGFTAIGMASRTSAEELRVFELAIAERQLASPDKTLRAQEGEELEFRVRSDETAELHVHGYDLMIPLQAGETTVTRLLATVAGRFPVTLHEPIGNSEHGYRHKRMLYLEVHPR